MPRNFKRNSSQLSLPRVGSKHSMKKNASTLSMTKLGNQPKSEKKKGTDETALKGAVDFSVGEDEQEDDWEEASSSQSPLTTRHSSVGQKTPQLEDPPSPDEPTQRSPRNLPQSPPQSPPTNPSAFVDYTKQNGHQRNPKHSQPLNGDEVSQRLLSRSKHSADPKLSNISATISPNGSSGSPVFTHNHDANFSKEPSMPADGISRFLSSNGSHTSSPAPDSTPHLQSRPAPNKRKDLPQPRRPITPTESPAPTVSNARRVQSAADLTHQGLKSDESSSVSPSPEEQLATKQQTKPSKPPRVSPYESARGADPSAGKSLTQLKLDLQRMSTMQEAPPNPHPLMFQHGLINGIQNPNAGSGEIAARLAGQYQQAGVEYKNARRFHPNLLIGQGLKKKVAGPKKKDEAIKGKGTGSKTPTTVATAGSSGNGTGPRGRVRFEIGVSPGDATEGLGEEGMHEGGAVEDLLMRMWDQRMDAGPEGE